MSESNPNPAEQNPAAEVAPPAASATPTPPPPPTGTPIDTTPPADVAPPAPEPSTSDPALSDPAVSEPTFASAFGPAATAPQGTALQDTVPAPTAPAPTASAAPTAPKQRSGAGMLVAGIALGALVGGATGAGISAWAVAANSGGGSDAPVSAPQTITVNDPDDVNVVNAVAAKAGPSVVTITVSASSAGGSGSGVILSDDGYVLTNNHVVTLDGASNNGTIEVTTADGRIFSAEVVGTDPIVDLAVIKLTGARDLTPIEFGDVDALDVGDRVVAIGAPLGLPNTVTDGIVSALDRSIQIASSAVPDDDSTEEDGGEGPFNFDFGQGQQSPGASGVISIPVIQTDAAINPGNSGGALVNASGELVGINVAIATAGGANTTSGSIGVGFAIPSDLARRIADELIENGAATHGLLGATVRDASSADGSIVGAYIDNVTSGGAAAEAGIRPGDIVTRFGGTPIRGSVDLTAQVRLHPAGDEVELVYVRGGDSRTVTVTLGEYQP